MRSRFPGGCRLASMNKEDKDRDAIPTGGSTPAGPSSQELLDLISKSQLNYRDLIDSLDYAVFTISLRGEIRVANRPLAAILGLEFPELIGHGLHDFLRAHAAASQRGASESARDRTLAGRIPVRFKKDPQQLRYYDCWLQLVDEEGRGKSVSGWARDATPQHEPEMRFAELFESLREGIFFTTPEGKLLDANPALVRMLGYEFKEDLKAHSFRDRYADAAQRDHLVSRISFGAGFGSGRGRLVPPQGRQRNSLSGFGVCDPRFFRPGHPNSGNAGCRHH